MIYDRAFVRQALQRGNLPQLRKLERFCRDRVELFTTAVPWPALANQWREDLRLVSQRLKELT